MKYKTENSIEQFTQDFASSRYKPDYYLDEMKGVLVEKPQKIDIQAEIDSYRDTELSAVFDKYLPEVLMNDSPRVAERDLTKLDRLMECSDEVEEMRTRYNLSPDLSISEVYQQVYDFYVKSLQKPVQETKQETKQETDKEVAGNET